MNMRCKWYWGNGIDGSNVDECRPWFLKMLRETGTNAIWKWWAYISHLCLWCKWAKWYTLSQWPLNPDTWIGSCGIEDTDPLWFETMLQMGTCDCCRATGPRSWKPLRWLGWRVWIGWCRGYSQILYICQELWLWYDGCDVLVWPLCANDWLHQHWCVRWPDLPHTWQTVPPLPVFPLRPFWSLGFHFWFWFHDHVVHSPLPLDLVFPCLLFRFLKKTTYRPFGPFPFDVLLTCDLCLFFFWKHWPPPSCLRWADASCVCWTALLKSLVRREWICDHVVAWLTLTFKDWTRLPFAILKG